MANTYTLITSQVLTGTASSVTLSSIPGTYKDLILYVSARTDNTSFMDLSVRFNGDSSATYSTRRLWGANTGTTSADSTSGTSAGSGTAHLASSFGNSNTAMVTGMFGAQYIYIPNYSSGSLTKTVGNRGGMADPNITSNSMWTGGYWAVTTAISSITCLPYQAGTNFLADTSFYLFGIG